MSTAKYFYSMRISNRSDKIKSNAWLIDAMAGNDRVIGGSAAQTIYGGSGHDSIQGMGGDDILWGDGSSTPTKFIAGHDCFVFEKTLTDNGVDTIMDFGISGHRTNGELQGGSYMADTLDLSHVKLTGLPATFEHRGHDFRHWFGRGQASQITAANVNDYVSIKGGDLYLDTDGLGVGKAQIWAHLDGVVSGDLVNLKLDKFQGQIEAKPGFNFQLDAVSSDLAINTPIGLMAMIAISDGDLTLNSDRALLLNGKLASDDDKEALYILDLVLLHGTEQTSNAALTEATWSADGQQALGTIDASTWTTESVSVNLFKVLVNIDMDSNDTIDYQDVTLYAVNDKGFNQKVSLMMNNVKPLLTEPLGELVAVYFNASAFNDGDVVELVGSYQGGSVSHSLSASPLGF